MDITKLGIMELKSLAYDEQVKLELARNNLLILAQEIQKRQTLPTIPEIPKEMEKKDEPKTV